MFSRHSIQSELQESEYTFLASGINLPYTVPEGYFSQLPGHVHDGVTAAENTDENAWGLLPPLGKTPFTVPQHYFTNLSNNILDTITKTDVAAKPTADNPQKIPAGYFDNLAHNILTKVKTADTPVVKLTPQKSNWLKYAVAAVITGLMVTIGLTYFTGPRPGNEQAVAAINTQVSQSLQSVTEQNLERIVNTLANETITEKTAAVAATKGNTKNEALVTDLLNDVSLNELTRFLNTFDDEDSEDEYADIN